MRILILFLSCCSLAIGASDDDNLLRNGGFEDGLEHWTCSNWADLPGAEFALDTDRPHGGDTSLRMGLDAFYGKYKNINLVYPLRGSGLRAGEVVEVSFWIRGAENMPPIRAALRRGAKPWTEHAALDIATSDAWTRHAFTCQLEKGMDLSKLQLLLSLGDPMTIWVDDVALRRIPERDPAPPLVGNRVVNGSFELGLERWYPFVAPSGHAYRANASMRAWNRMSALAPPAVVAIDDAVHGGSVLRLEIGPGMEGLVQSAYVPLRYGHPVTIAFSWLGPPSASLDAQLCTPGWGKAQETWGQRFAADGSTWQRCSFTVTPEPTAAGRYYLRLHSEDPGVHLIDDVIVADGESASERTAPGLALGWQASQPLPPGRLYHRGEVVGFELLAAAGDGDTAVPLALRVVDVEGGVVHREELSVALDAAGRGRLALTLPGERYGAFLAEIRPQGAGSDELPLLEWQYQVLPDLGSPGAVEDRFFGGHAALSDHALAVCERVGIRSIRCHPPINTKWRALERAPGEWDLDAARRGLQRAADRGFDIVGNLELTPDFHADLDSPHGKHDWRGYGTKPPKDWARYRDYVARTVAAFGDIVAHWEVGNEPGPDEVELYQRYVRETAQAIEEAGLETSLVAGAFHAIEARWAPEIIGSSVHDLASIWSFHIYGGTVNAEREALIRAWSALPHRDRARTRLWMTEGAYLPSAQTWYRTVRMPEATPATMGSMVARSVVRLVELKALGVERNYQFPPPTATPTGQYINKLRFNAGSDVNGLPLPLWAGHAACVRFLEGAAPAADGPEDLDHDGVTVRRCRFVRGEQAIDVLWASAPRRLTDLAELVPADAEAFDLMGNPLATEAEIPAGSPVYVVAGLRR